MRLIFSLFAVLAAACLSSYASASDPAGNAVAVIQDASGELAGARATIITGDGIYMGQRIVTGGVGQVQVVFADNTHLVVGPHSTLVIASYLMRNDGTANKVVVNALSGTFRFLTGNSAKKAYEIDTPTGTLGVRGTAFDFSVDPRSHETRVLLYHGGVDMCAQDGTCVALDEACSVGVIPKQADAAVLRDSDKRKPPILNSFKYLASQRALRQDFRLPGIAGCKSSAGPEVRTTQADPAPPAPALVAEVPQPKVDPPSKDPPGDHEEHHDEHHDEHHEEHHEQGGEGGGGDDEHGDGEGNGNGNGHHWRH